MNPVGKTAVRVGEWRVEPLRGALFDPDGKSHHLKPKVMDVLLCLAEHAGQPVTRDELIECVWGERGASDEVLTKAVSELRQVLGDTAGLPRYIETIPKRGYRLIASVGGPRDGRGETRRRTWSPYLALGVPILFLALAFVLLSRQVGNDTEPAGVVVPPNSIAVLPFSTGSELADDEIFAAGLHGDLVTLLTRSRSIDKVVASTSSARYAGTNKSIHEIGAELGVATVLTGSLRRIDETVRINLRLTDASDETVLWSQSYDRGLTIEQIFGMQTEITREVAAALHGVFPTGGEPTPVVFATSNIEAYREYVLGRAALARRTASELMRARAHFEKAATLDPQYAAAWTGLADVLTALPEYAGIPAGSLREQRAAAINRALVIDPLSGEAYANLADLHALEGRPEQAEEAFLRAIELAPNYATAHHWYALFLRNMGRFELALVHISKAVDIDPFAPVLSTVSADIHMSLVYYDEAEAILAAAIERDPDFPTHYSSLGALRQSQGRYDLALLLVDRALELNPSGVWLNRGRCYLLFNLGDEAGLRECALHIADAFPELGNHYLGLDRLYHGEFDAALDLMARGELEWERALYGFNSTLVGRNDEARAIFDRIYPQFESGAPFELTNFASLAAAAGVGRLLYLDGRDVRANELFDAVVRWRRDPRPVYFAQYIHLTRGHLELAKDALRLAYERGLVADWWLLNTPVFAPLHADPDWAETFAAIQAAIEVQRISYYSLKSDPEACITCIEPLMPASAEASASKREQASSRSFSMSGNPASTLNSGQSEIRTAVPETTIPPSEGMSTDSRLGLPMSSP